MKIRKNKVGSILVGIIMLLSSMALLGSVNVFGGGFQGGISASDEFGETKDTFNLEETVFMAATGLTENTHFNVYVVLSTINEEDNLANADVTIGPEKFTTNLDGELEHNVVWWYPSTQGTYKIVVDTDWDGLYDSSDLSHTITISALSTQEVHATDSLGNRDTGFYYGGFIPGQGYTGEPIYTKGGFFPESTEVDIYVVDDKVEWIYGYPLVDKSGEVERVFIPSTGNLPKTCIWSTPLKENAGIYDIVVDVDLNGYFTSGDAVSSGRLAGITIAGEPPAGGHIEDEIASFGYLHQDYFAIGQKVYAYVNPSCRGYIPPGSQADIYVYLDRHWNDGDTLNDGKDVSGGHETITPQFHCNNQWLTLIWPSATEVNHGYYDILIDNNQNGLYDIGIDLLDKNWGFGFTLTGKHICASNTLWQRVDTFDVGESVFMEARGLLPSSHYNVYVVPAAICPGSNLASADVSGGFERFTTNIMGELEGNVIWWFPSTTGMYKIVVDDNHNGLYDIIDLSMVITITDMSLCEIYPTDSMGIFDTGFLFGESVYAKGGGFPPSTYVAIYVTEENLDWVFSDSLTDVSGGEEIVQTTAQGEVPVTSIWSSVSSTDIGVYDIIVDVDQNGLFNLGDALFSSRIAGITLQGEGESDEHLEDEIAAYYVGGHTYCIHKDDFNLGEDVYAYVNPGYRSNIPPHSQADVYVYPDRYWADGDPLNDVNDVSGGHETLSPCISCNNAYYILIWSNMQKVGTGYYDVIIDCDQDGLYDIGYDLLDKHIDYGFSLVGNDPEIKNILYSDDVEIGERQWAHVDDTGSWIYYSYYHSWYSGKGHDIMHDLNHYIDLTDYVAATTITVYFFNKRVLADPGEDKCSLYIWTMGGLIAFGTTWDTNTVNPWDEDSYDLTLYKGQEIKLNFKYETDGDQLSDGWWIDDVRIVVDEGLGSEETIFTDNMESGVNEWEASGWSYGYKEPDKGDLWHITTTKYHGGASSWWCGSESSGTYVPSMDNNLISTRFPLLAHSDAHLTFYVDYEIDADDSLTLEIKTEVSSWYVLDTYVGDSGGWIKKQYSLQSYIEEIVQIRFHMESNENAVSGEGFCLDDLEIRIQTTEKAKWTYIAYFDGDNNLEACMIADLNELELVGSTTDVNFIMMLDRYSGMNYEDGQYTYAPGDDDISNGNWTNTRSYYITPDQDGGLINSFRFGPELDTFLFADDVEQNMGSPTVLTNFANWVKGYYPADNYILVLSDHGGGIYGVCWDEDSQEDNLEYFEIESALDTITAQGTEPFSVLQFAVCLEAMNELVYQLQYKGSNPSRPYTDYVVASEEVSVGSSVPNGDFQAVATLLTTNPSVSSINVAKEMVDAYFDAFWELTPLLTMSAIDTSKIGCNGDTMLVNAIHNFAYWMWKALEDSNPAKATYAVDFTNARLLHTDSYFPAGYHQNCDMYNYAKRLYNLYQAEPRPGDYEDQIETWAGLVMDYTAQTPQSAVVYEYSGVGHPKSDGLAIYFPHSGVNPLAFYDKDYYETLDFCDTYWNEFLERYCIYLGMDLEPPPGWSPPFENMNIVRS